MTASEQALDRPSRTGQTRRGVVAGLAAVGGVLAACAAPGSDTAPAASAKEVTISYVSDWSAAPRSDWIKAAIPPSCPPGP